MWTHACSLAEHCAGLWIWFNMWQNSRRFLYRILQAHTFPNCLELKWWHLRIQCEDDATWLQVMWLFSAGRSVSHLLLNQGTSDPPRTLWLCPCFIIFPRKFPGALILLSCDGDTCAANDQMSMHVNEYLQQETAVIKKDMIFIWYGNVYTYALQFINYSYCLVFFWSVIYIMYSLLATDASLK